MRRLSLIVLSVLICTSISVAQDTRDDLPPAPPGQTWKMIWHDEFDGTKLDDSKWVYRPDGKRKDGWWDRKAVALDGKGHLSIRTYKDGDKYVDGCITTQGKFEHAFGYYVARIRLQKQPGHWSAFWITGPGVHKVGDEGRNGTEIDIMEKPWLDDRVQHTFHWDGYGKAHKSEGKVVKVPGVMEGWHTFAIWWKPDEYVFYVDGKETWRTKGGGPCQVPEYMLLSDEIGKWGGDITKARLPDRFEVDYVRVYLPAREDLSLRKFLLDDLLQSYAKEDELCYVSFGSQFDEKSGRTVHDDPPQSFLEQFKGRTYRVKPASSYPEGKNRRTPERNPKSKVPDGIYEIEIVEWIDANTAKVRVSMYRAPLWAAGHEATVERKEGRWRIREYGILWAS